MHGPGVLFFQMHERAGDLDEAFEKTVVVILASQPEVLQNIMGFVVIATVEAFEKTGVTGVNLRRVRFGERCDKCLDAVVFRHGINQA